MKQWLKPIPPTMTTPKGEVYQFYQELNGHGWLVINKGQATLMTEPVLRVLILLRRMS